METQSISRNLARFIHRLSFDDIPSEVVDRAKNLILDGLATAIAGLALPYYRIGLELVKDNKGDAVIFGHRLRVPPIDAAFVNSVLLASIGQSDELGRGHPADVVLPTTVAVAEQEGSSGAEAITALIVGYDIFARIFWGAPSIIPRFRATPVVGPLAATATAGKLLGLGEDQLTNALGYAANFSSGFPECYTAGTMESRFHAPMASRNGITAAILARAGAIAAEKSLEGEAGFYQAFAGTNEVLDAAIADLGKKFSIMETKYKPFPCCGSLQTPVDLALNLAKQHDIKSGDIDNITEILPYDVFSYPGINYAGPFTTPIKAKMSGQFCAAASLLGKPVASFSFFNNNYTDPGVSELAKKVTLVGEKNRDATRMTKIEVTLRDGRRYSIDGGVGEVLVPTTARIQVKFENLTSEFLGRERAGKVIGIVLTLDKVENIHVLTQELGEVGRGY